MSDTADTRPVCGCPSAEDDSQPLCTRRVEWCPRCGSRGDQPCVAVVDGKRYRMTQWHIGRVVGDVYVPEGTPRTYDPPPEVLPQAVEVDAWEAEGYMDDLLAYGGAYAYETPEEVPEVRKRRTRPRP